ncbi:MAG: hypothetical protein KGH68_01350, partial [Patescibacteria group bacterium]|nr:hypothetical protein [Patescibacteria group bacterium]
GLIGSGGQVISGGSANDFAVSAYGTGGLIFGTNGGSARMTIANGGNVGIGTTSPGALLDLSSSAPYLRLTATTGTNYVQQDFVNTGGTVRVGAENSSGGGLLNGTSPYAGVFGTTGANPLQFSTNNNVRMTVASGGNVGIGTTSPNYKLDVQSASGPQASFGNGIYSGTGASGAIRIGDANITKAYGSNFVFASGIAPDSDNSRTNGTSTARWSDVYTTGIDSVGSPLAINANSSGNVGVGTSSPAQAFSVSGTGYFAGSVGIGTAAPARALDISQNNAQWYQQVVENLGSTGGGGIQFRNDGTGSSNQGAYVMLGGSNTGYSEYNKRLDLISYANGSAGTGSAGITLSMEGTSEGTQDVRIINGPNGSPILDVLQTGNVGIGTSSPQSQLNLYASTPTLQLSPSGYGGNTYSTYLGAMSNAIGELQLGNNGVNYIVGGNSGVGGALQFVVNNTAAFPTTPNGTTAMFINSSGNVGIGTTSPTQGLLQVEKSQHGNTNVFISNPDTTASDYNTQARLELAVGGNTIGALKTTEKPLTGLSTPALYLTTEGSYPIAFGINNSPTPSEVIDTTGNLGIGTSTPMGKLSISSYTSGQGVDVDYGNATGQVESISLLANGVVTGRIGVQMRQSPSEGDLWLGGSSGRVLTVASSGDVGVGTSTPGAKLDAYTSSGDSLDISKANGSPYLGLISTSGNNFYLNNNVGVLSVLKNDALTPIMSFLQNGNVGIGTTNPGGLLDVHKSGAASPANSGSAGTGGLRISNGFASNVLDMGQDASGNSWIQSYANSGALSTYANLNLNPNGGNVGIGSTSPSASLVVNGGNNSYSFGTNNELILGSTNNPDLTITSNAGSLDTEVRTDISLARLISTGLPLDLAAPSGQYLTLTAGGSERVRVTSGGNVGIGTTTPNQQTVIGGTGSHALAVTGLSGGQFLLLGNEDSLGVSAPSSIEGANGGLYFGHGSSWSNSTGGTISNGMFIAQSGGVSIGSYATNSNDAGSNNLIVSGSVGIGTTTPSQVLSVQGGLYASGNAFIGGTFTATSTATFGDATHTGIIKLTNGDGSANSVTITNDGQGNALIRGTVTVGNNLINDTTGAGLTVQAGSGGALTLATNGGSGSVYLSPNGSVALTAMNGGNVGIGTTNPSSRLDIVGSATSSPVLTLRDPLGNVSFELRASTSTLQNTFVGEGAGAFNTTGQQETAVGYGSLNHNTTGTGNTATGFWALLDNTSGGSNTANGYGALYLNTSGPNNTATGYMALAQNSNGGDNTAAGVDALSSNQTGDGNTATGFYALEANTSGGDNTAEGIFSLGANTTGNNNSVFGSNALNYSTTGSFNAAVGSLAMYSNTTGWDNTVVGGYALYANTSATNTVAIGYAAAEGGGAYYSQGGTYIGSYAGQQVATSSDYNTFIGYASGYSNTTGGYNVAIGQNVDLASSTGSQQLNIGNLIYGTGLYNGGSDSSTPVSAGKVGIGTSTPTSTLTISGSLCLDRGAGTASVACGTTAGELYYNTAAAGNYDVAEDYQASDMTIAAGDIVRLDPNTKYGLLKAGVGDSIFGVISTNPGLVLGGSDRFSANSSSTRPVALSGRVPVKVNGQGGDIVIGDRIALSSVPGVGKKASGSEETVGIALEPWSGGALDQGLIDVFVTVKQNFSQSQFAIDGAGNVGIGTSTPGYKLQVNGVMATNGLVLVGAAGSTTPTDVLDATGQGIDLAKMSTFVLSNEAALATRLDALTAQVASNTEDIAALKSSLATTTAEIAALQSQEANQAANAASPTSALAVESATTTEATTTQTIVWSSDLSNQIVAFLETVGLKLQNGIAYIQNAIVSSLTADVAYIKNATIDSASVGALTIGSEGSRTGITLYDQLTGDPYCLSIAGGQPRTTAGACPTAASSTPPVTAPATGVSGSLVTQATPSVTPQAVEPASVADGSTTAVTTAPMQTDTPATAATTTTTTTATTATTTADVATSTPDILTVTATSTPDVATTTVATTTADVATSTPDILTVTDATTTATSTTP